MSTVVAGQLKDALTKLCAAKLKALTAYGEK